MKDPKVIEREIFDAIYEARIINFNIRGINTMVELVIDTFPIDSETERFFTLKFTRILKLDTDYFMFDNLDSYKNHENKSSHYVVDFEIDRNQDDMFIVNIRTSGSNYCIACENIEYSFIKEYSNK